MKLKAAFFDRDGVLNVDKSYLYKIEDLEWIDGAKEALAYLTQQGYTVFVVTNQSGIARGYYTVDDMNKLHNYMEQQVAAEGGKIEKFYYCPHLPEGKIAEYAVECDCRKPKPGLILRSFEEYDIDKDAAFLIGAEAAGIKGYLFSGGNLLNFVKEIVG